MCVSSCPGLLDLSRGLKSPIPEPPVCCMRWWPSIRSEASVLPSGCWGSRCTVLDAAISFITICGPPTINRWIFCSFWRRQTAEHEGISAAGSTVASRRYTALADAELLIHGPARPPLASAASARRRVPGPAQPCGGATLDVEAAGRGPRLGPETRFSLICTSSPWTKARRPVCPVVRRCRCRGCSICGDRENAWASVATPLGGGGVCSGGHHHGSSGVDGPRRGGCPSDQRQCASSAAATQESHLVAAEGFSGLRLGAHPSAEQILAAVGDPFPGASLQVCWWAVSAGQPFLLGAVARCWLFWPWRCRLWPPIGGPARRPRC